MSQTRAERRRVPVLNLHVDLCDHESAIARISALARAGEGGYICVANVHGTIEGEDDASFSELVNNADLVLPDGTPLVWMQRLQGHGNASQVRGPSLMPMLMRHAEQNGLKVGFLGGRQEVLDRIVARASDEFPELDIAYTHSPPFRDLSADENAAMAASVNESGVQILFVGLGCPKQERWMARNRNSVKAVMIGVGAAFDLYAGNLREAPGIVSRLGLEWMFRLVQEPRRLFSRYLLVNPRFVYLATRQLMARRSRPEVPKDNG
jgi:N-acetylglucosaminyldiphosphoundecaprenol N-acetyl-beta-D-mannosaminyltransferase